MIPFFAIVLPNETAFISKNAGHNLEYKEMSWF